MKNTKLFIVILFALVLALAACGVSNDDAPPAVQGIPLGVPTATSTPAPGEDAYVWVPVFDLEHKDNIFDNAEQGEAIAKTMEACGAEVGATDTLLTNVIGYEQGVLINCFDYADWQLYRSTDGRYRLQTVTAEATATPAATVEHRVYNNGSGSTTAITTTQATPEAVVEKAPAIATGEPLSLFAHDADAPEGPPSSIGWGPEENGFVVVVGVDIAYAEGNWEIPGSGCEQLLLLSGYMRNASIDDGSFWSYVVDADVAAADPDTVTEYALLTARTWAFQQAEDEGCQEIVNPDAPLDHTWVGWENEDGSFTFVPYPEFRRSTGENNTTRFFKGDVVYGWHIGFGDSQDDVCDGGGCYLNPAPQDGWVGGGVINSTWPGEIPADAVNLAP